MPCCLKKTDWSTDQQKAIDLLARGGMTYDAIAKECNTSTHTIYNWRKDPDFMDEVISRAQSILKEELPEVYDALRSNAKGGNPKHIDIYLKHLERLEEIRSKYSQNAISFTWEPCFNADNNS